MSRRCLYCSLLFLLILVFLPAPAQADLRIAIWNVELSRQGPGLLVRDIVKGEDPQTAAIVTVLDALDADVILLAGIDYDRELVAARLLSDRLAKPYPHLFAVRPNTGIQTGLDLDGNGRTGDADDAQGWGHFAGYRGMVLLSRLSMDESRMRDFSGFLWADLPDAMLYEGMSDEAKAIQRLSSTGHWEVPLILPSGGHLRILAWHATPPAFSRPAGRNENRNHDETAFWLALLDGRLPFARPESPFVLMGISNRDPVDGDGHDRAVRSLLAHPLLRDPQPRGTHERNTAEQRGDAALDTAHFDRTGGLRAALLLPSSELEIQESGVLWPNEDDPLWPVLQAASRHFPVWTDVITP